MATLKNTTISGTGAAALPRGTYAQRPSAANGMMRFNSNTRTSEIYTAANTSSSTWAAIQGHDIVKQNLLLWYDFGDLTSYTQGGATSVTNLIRGDYNGVMWNMAPTYSGSNQGYLTFDGTNDHIAVSNSITDFAWTQGGAYGSSAITVEIWFQSSDTGGRLICKPWNGSGQYNYWIDPGAGTPYWYIAGGNPHNGATINFAANIFNGSWQHLVCWANSTQLGYYINGGQYSGSGNHGLSFNVLPSSGLSVDFSINTLYPYTSWAGDSGHAIAGNTAIVRYYTSALTAAQAYQNFSAERHRFGI